MRYGGLGISNPMETGDREYNASKRITANLTRLIIQQEQDISLYNHEETASVIKQVVSEKEAYLNKSLITLSPLSMMNIFSAVLLST